MQIYSDSFKQNKSKGDLKIIESRISWIISIATSMMNLSYAPIVLEDTE